MNRGSIAAAAALLTSGSIVAFPTETFFGLAVLPGLPDAVDRLAELKSRGLDQGIPLILDSAERVGPLLLPGESPDLRRSREEIQARFWPGPLSLVIAADETACGYAPLVYGPGRSLAVRVSPHATARALAEAVGGPITATSANPHGAPPPCSRADVEHYYPEIFIVDGCCGAEEPGTDKLGQSQRPSTLLDVRTFPFKVLREGAVSLTELQVWLA